MYAYTVEPDQAATSIKQSSVLKGPVQETFIWIQPLLRGHLSYNATFSFSQMWPLNWFDCILIVFLHLRLTQFKFRDLHQTHGTSFLNIILFTLNGMINSLQHCVTFSFLKNCKSWYIKNTYHCALVSWEQLLYHFLICATPCILVSLNCHLQLPIGLKRDSFYVSITLAISSRVFVIRTPIRQDICEIRWRSCVIYKFRGQH